MVAHDSRDSLTSWAGFVDLCKLQEGSPTGLSKATGPSFE